jgi:MscS family membrane protein
VAEVIAHAYKILVVLNVTWFVARFAVDAIAEYLTAEKEPRKGKVYFDKHLLPVIKRSILILIWIVGGITALSEAGIKVTTLLGTLGIGGIAFALAAQDTIKNILGGITIFVDKSFRIGDLIIFNGSEGFVEDIGLRSTRIRTYDKRLVIVPNYKIMDAPVINVAAEPARRVVATLGLTYDTPVEKMREAIVLLQRIPMIVEGIEEEGLVAAFTEFGNFSLNITFIYFVEKVRWPVIRETISEVNLEVLRAFNAAGLDFAFPTQTVFIENGKSQLVTSNS